MYLKGRPLTKKSLSEISKSDINAVSDAIKILKLKYSDSSSALELIENDSLISLELKEALKGPVDVIMLDNFSIDMLKEAIELKGNSDVKFEASGNVNLDTIKAIAQTGVDFISVGDLTKSVTAIDLSLRVLGND